MVVTACNPGQSWEAEEEVQGQPGYKMGSCHKRIKERNRVEAAAQLAECVPGMHEVLGLMEMEAGRSNSRLPLATKGAPGHHGLPETLCQSKGRTEARRKTKTGFMNPEW